MAFDICILLIGIEFFVKTELNSIVSDINNQFYDCVKDKKVEQNDLDRMHATKHNIPSNQNKGKH